MSDKALAQVARALGAALIHLARERDEESKKRISALHTELCAIYRQDVAEQAVLEKIALEAESVSR